MRQRESIGKWLSTIYRKSQIYINKNLERYNISSSQYLILLILQRNEGINQEAISKELYLDKATIARAVNKLLNERYITRKVDPNDGRAYILFLTKKGRDVVPKIRNVLNRTSDIFLTGFSAHEKEMAFKLLMKMHQNMTTIENH
ncbi:MAG: MarR family transcriptional regulator [Thermoplasmata archaeon]|nr:MarR family transcriptional regulator [Thermoplasmata archaeon]